MFWRQYKDKKYWHWQAGLCLFVLVWLYVVGLKPLLPLILVALAYVRMPVPPQLGSKVGRILAAAIYNIVFLQIAAIVQFALFPRSNFYILAGLYAVIGWLFVAFVGWRQTDKSPFMTRYDVAGLIVAAVYVLPFMPLLIGHDTIQNIVAIAGIQSPDAGHHFDFINTTTYNQHLDTSGYPKSFHLGVGFLQDAFVGSQEALSWRTNALVFFAQYVLMGGLLAMALGYMLLTWLQNMTKRLPPRSLVVVCAIGLALAANVLVLWPFVVHGFLNYFYVAALAAMTLTSATAVVRHRDKLGDPLLPVVLLLALGVSLGWPLLTPAILVSLLVTALPFGWRDVRPFVRRHTLLAVLVVLQCAPVLIQIAGTGTTSINDEGDLRILDGLVLSAVIVAAALSIRWVTAEVQRLSVDVFLPLILLMSGILVLQLFLFGQPRYFAIKVALLLLALLLPISVAALGAASIRYAWPGRYAPGIALLPLVVLLPLIAASSSPLVDVRNLFRDQSGQGKPEFYDHDVYEYARLGKEGKINYFNSTVLHYHESSGTFYSHPFLPQVVQDIKYYRTPKGLEAEACHRAIFQNIAYGAFTHGEQQALISQIHQCADDAHRNGQPYYIITDSVSLPFVKTEVGEDGGIVYVGS